MTQTITTVFDVARNDGSYDWTLSSLFEREITQACPLASTSSLVLHLPQTTQYLHQYELVPLPEQGTKAVGSEDNFQEIAVYDLKKSHGSPSSPFQLSFRWENSRPKSGKSSRSHGVRNQLHRSTSTDVHTMFDSSLG